MTMTTTATVATETDGIRYVATQVDTISVWKIQNGKIENIAHDLYIVTCDDYMKPGSNTGDAHIGDWIDTDTTEVFTIPGVDLNKIECLVGVNHSVEDIQKYLANK